MADSLVANQILSTRMSTTPSKKESPKYLGNVFHEQHETMDIFQAGGPERVGGFKAKEILIVALKGKQPISISTLERQKEVSNDWVGLALPWSQ